MNICQPSDQCTALYPASATVSLSPGLHEIFAQADDFYVTSTSWTGTPIRFEIHSP